MALYLFSCVSLIGVDVENSQPEASNHGPNLTELAVQASKFHVALNVSRLP